jgi:hypothetical protein
MGNKIKMYLDLPDPCSENWENMLPGMNGRFCQRCRKEVIDFTTMSDSEILKFFVDKTNIPCGSFRQDQIDRFYVPQKKKIQIKFAGLISSLLALLSFKSLTATTHSDFINITNQQNIDSISNDNLTVNDSLRIYGHVLVRESSLLENEPIIVKISNTKLETTVDKDGNYQIELDQSEISQYTLITFYHSVLKQETRSIHKSCFPQKLDIEMVRPPSGRIGGAPIPYYGK